MFDEIWKKQDEQKLQVLKSVDVTNDIKKSLEVIGLENIEKAFENGLISEDILEKARSGVYKNTPENRKKGRVGQKYGGGGKSGEGIKLYDIVQYAGSLWEIVYDNKDSNTWKLSKYNPKTKTTSHWDSMNVSKDDKKLKLG